MEWRILLTTLLVLMRSQAFAAPSRIAPVTSSPSDENPDESENKVIPTSGIHPPVKPGHGPRGNLFLAADADATEVGTFTADDVIVDAVDVGTTMQRESNTGAMQEEVPGDDPILFKVESRQKRHADPRASPAPGPFKRRKSNHRTRVGSSRRRSRADYDSVYGYGYSSPFGGGYNLGPGFSY